MTINLVQLRVLALKLLLINEFTCFKLFAYTDLLLRETNVVLNLSLHQLNILLKLTHLFELIVLENVPRV